MLFTHLAFGFLSSLSLRLCFPSTCVTQLSKISSKDHVFQPNSFALWTAFFQSISNEVIVSTTLPRMLKSYPLINALEYEAYRAKTSQLKQKAVAKAVVICIWLTFVRLCWTGLETESKMQFLRLISSRASCGRVLIAFARGHIEATNLSFGYEKLPSEPQSPYPYQFWVAE